MKSVLLVGLGTFGTHIALQLNRLGHQVMGVDRSEDRVNEAMDIVTNAHGGEITLTDNVPKGCVFRFTVPSGEVNVNE